MKQKKKIVCIVVGVIFILICVIVIGLSDNKENAQDILKDNVYQCIMDDNFTTDSKIEKKIKEEITIFIEDVDSTCICIEIEAPNIAEGLFVWVYSQDEENLTPEKLEEKILMLLSESPKEKVHYELLYRNDEKMEISYTQECKDTLSCGMIKFYNMAMQKVIEELKEGVQ